MLFTVYALFGDDVRLLLFGAEADYAFTILNVITLVLFTLELVLSSIGIKTYFGNFFFWLDLISTISIITDIEPVWLALMGIGDSEQPLEEDDLSRRGTERGVRISSQAGRMARIVRLFRLIRIVKLYKATMLALEKEAQRSMMME